MCIVKTLALSTAIDAAFLTLKHIEVLARICIGLFTGDCFPSVDCPTKVSGLPQL
jgi:hypothetical protein